MVSAPAASRMPSTSCRVMAPPKGRHHTNAQLPTANSQPLPTLNFQFPRTLNWESAVGSYDSSRRTIVLHRLFVGAGLAWSGAIVAGECQAWNAAPTGTD